MSYISKLKTPDETIYPIGSALYGTCTTAAATAAKVAIIDSFDTLETGVTVFIKFTYSNTAATPTLAIKPSSSGTATTAKSIMRYGTTKPGTTTNTSWQAGEVVSFTYDGTYWQMNTTVYTSKAAASGGTEVSLVTTGEKNTWNGKASYPIVTEVSASDSNLQYKKYTSSSESSTISILGSKAAASGGTDISLVTTGEKYTWDSVSGKLDKAGDTMTGRLLINYQHPELQFKTTDWTINTTSNNGLSEDAGTGTVQMYGNDNTIIGRFNVYGNPAGATRARMQCYNKTTSGDTVTAGFGVQANKNGTVEYYVESPETLRQTCHGAYGWRQWTTAGTTYTVSNNAPAEFHYGIMMSGTTTASLFVIGGSPGSYALTLTKLTSTDLKTNFTVTLNATSGKLTVKNKSSSNISFCILGY